MKKIWRDVREILRGAAGLVVVRILALLLGALGVKEAVDLAAEADLQAQLGSSSK